VRTSAARAPARRLGYPRSVAVRRLLTPRRARDAVRLREFLIALLVPVVLMAIGTAGYMRIEHWRPLESLYMTVITISTVGFAEVHPLSSEGRVFTMALILTGVFTLLYAATSAIRAIVSGEVRGDIGRQRMERTLEELKDHVIVCGYGRMGRFVCTELSASGQPFVVLDKQAAVLEGFQLPQGIALAGDATSDGVLRRAGIDRARVLVSAAASDADNLYVTLSARLLNEKIFIVARAEDEGTEKKLLRAGANRVVSPYVIAGQTVVQAVVRPDALSFLEMATRRDYQELQIEEVEVQPGSPLAGAQVRDPRVRREMGIIIVAIKKPGGKMAFNPAPEAMLEARDVLICLGHRDQLERLVALAGGPRSA
jgi:voltage-gated potassium channel